MAPGRQKGGRLNTSPFWPRWLIGFPSESCGTRQRLSPRESGVHRDATMSTELARFDTCRAAQSDESSEQTDLRTIGAREHGQLALDELDTENQTTISKSQASADTQATEEPTREDLEAALGCAHAMIDGLREQVAQLEAERDRLQQELENGR